MEMITIKVSKKPPIPPKPQKAKLELPSRIAKGSQIQWKTDEDNHQQIKKLIAMNDKLIVEFGDLRNQLHHERVAVRELRCDK